MPDPDRRPALRLDGFEPADDSVDRDFYDAIDSNLHTLCRLAEHHTPDGRHSYHVIFDESVTWGIPGLPQLLALHIDRDLTAKTFTFEFASLPLAVMVQSWLISRGCPREEIRLPKGMGTTPADKRTVALQERLMGDGDHFALLHSDTDDSAQAPVVVVVLRALDEKDPHPYRLLHEVADMESFTHTLREGVFPTFDAAMDWIDGPNVPLRPAPLTSRTAPRQAPVQPPIPGLARRR
ncbi:hypothetical protein [Streptomyces sp. NBC_01264]|uniref:hypothetical protein n=1 Tax=Streptomyces sp. NBC_01264 TaxID=2903804 RepID=UPI00225AF0B8|nr:hypothetical protein [Streptomyces sp. NBC_01264]MCX4776856.1 hypothetical protein [Streptomyces sp. NBC_01264]